MERSRSSSASGSSVPHASTELGPTRTNPGVPGLHGNLPLLRIPSPPDSHGGTQYSTPKMMALGQGQFRLMPEQWLMHALPQHTGHLKPELAMAVTQELLKDAGRLMAEPLTVPQRVSECVVRLMAQPSHPMPPPPTPSTPGEGANVFSSSGAAYRSSPSHDDSGSGSGSSHGGPPSGPGTYAGPVPFPYGPQRGFSANAAHWLTRLGQQEAGAAGAVGAAAHGAGAGVGAGGGPPPPVPRTKSLPPKSPCSPTREFARAAMVRLHNPWLGLAAAAGQPPSPLAPRSVASEGAQSALQPQQLQEALQQHTLQVQLQGQGQGHPPQAQPLQQLQPLALLAPSQLGAPAELPAQPPLQLLPLSQLQPGAPQPLPLLQPSQLAPAAPGLQPRPLPLLQPLQFQPSGATPGLLPLPLLQPEQLRPALSSSSPTLQRQLQFQRSNVPLFPPRPSGPPFAQPPAAAPGAGYHQPQQAGRCVLPAPLLVPGPSADRPLPHVGQAPSSCGTDKSAGDRGSGPGSASSQALSPSGPLAAPGEPPLPLSGQTSTGSVSRAGCTAGASAATTSGPSTAEYSGHTTAHTTGSGSPRSPAAATRDLGASAHVDAEGASAWASAAATAELGPWVALGGSTDSEPTASTSAEQQQQQQEAQRAGLVAPASAEPEGEDRQEGDRGLISEVGISEEEGEEEGEEEAREGSMPSLGYLEAFTWDPENGDLRRAPGPYYSPGGTEDSGLHLASGDLDNLLSLVHQVVTNTLMPLDSDAASTAGSALSRMNSARPSLVLLMDGGSRPGTGGGSSATPVELSPHHHQHNHYHQQQPGGGGGGHTIQVLSFTSGSSSPPGRPYRPRHSAPGSLNSMAGSLVARAEGLRSSRLGAAAAGAPGNSGADAAPGLPLSPGLSAHTHGRAHPQSVPQLSAVLRQLTRSSASFTAGSSVGSAGGGRRLQRTSTASTSHSAGASPAPPGPPAERDAALQAGVAASVRKRFPGPGGLAPPLTQLLLAQCGHRDLARVAAEGAAQPDMVEAVTAVALQRLLDENALLKSRLLYQQRSSTTTRTSNASFYSAPPATGSPRHPAAAGLQPSGSGGSMSAAPSASRNRLAARSGRMAAAAAAAVAEVDGSHSPATATDGGPRARSYCVVHMLSTGSSFGAQSASNTSLPTVGGLAYSAADPLAVSLLSTSPACGSPLIIVQPAAGGGPSGPQSWGPRSGGSQAVDALAEMGAARGLGGSHLSTVDEANEATLSLHAPGGLQQAPSLTHNSNVLLQGGGGSARTSLATAAAAAAAAAAGAASTAATASRAGSRAGSLQLYNAQSMSIEGSASSRMQPSPLSLSAFRRNELSPRSHNSLDSPGQRLDTADNKHSDKARVQCLWWPWLLGGRKKKA